MMEHALDFEQGRNTVLVTGVTGQVGFEMLRTLQGFGRVVAADRAMLDLSDIDSIRACVRQVRPALIVNPAAYTAVDNAEKDVALARAINADAPAVLAEEARRTGALLVHYSTDYVFDGRSNTPYAEDDAVNPLNVYGLTKLEGERAITASACRHIIFRTSWVYGSRGKNFLLTMLRLAQDRDELRIVADQIGAPTWSASIAAMTAEVLAQGLVDDEGFAQWAERKSGIYHLTSSGHTSWAGFASAIFEEEELAERVKVIPIPSSDYPVPAKRPMNSRLDVSKLAASFGIVPPDWRDALRVCLRLK